MDYTSVDKIKAKLDMLGIKYTVHADYIRYKGTDGFIVYRVYDDVGSIKINHRQCKDKRIRVRTYGDLKRLSFEYNSSVEEIDIDTPNSKLETMSNMFSSCEKLVKIQFTSIDTSQVKTMEGMFYGCGKLESVNLEKIDTRSCTNFRGAFQNCRKLTSLDLRTWDMSSALTVSDIFRGCQNLADINIDGWDTSKVYDFRNMFYGCEKLLKLDASQISIENGEYLSWMFAICQSLTELNISSWHGDKVSTLCEMFVSCTSLEHIVGMEQLSLSRLTSLNRTFDNCESLRRIEIPNIVVHNSWQIELNRAFEKCLNINEIDMRNISMQGGRWLQSPFNRCKNLRVIRLYDFTTDADDVDISSSFKGCNSLEEIWLYNPNLTEFEKNSMINCIREAVKRSESAGIDNLTGNIKVYILDEEVASIDIKGWYGDIGPDVEEDNYIYESLNTDCIFEGVDEQGHFCAAHIAEDRVFSCPYNKITAKTKCTDYISDSDKANKDLVDDVLL